MEKEMDHGRMPGIEMKEQVTVHVNAAGMRGLVKDHGRKLGTGMMELEKLLGKLARKLQEVPVILLCIGLGSAQEALVTQLWSGCSGALGVQGKLHVHYVDSELVVQGRLREDYADSALEVQAKLRVDYADIALVVQAKQREDCADIALVVQAILHGYVSHAVKVELARLLERSEAFWKAVEVI